MKRILTLAVLAPTAALAHPGDHGGFSLQAMITHLLSEPDHIVMALGAVAVVLVLIYRTRAHK